MNILQPPVLEHDTMMAERFGSTVHPTGRIERRLVWNLLHHLNAAGFQIAVVDDGDDATTLDGSDEVRNLAAMNLLFNLDEASVYFAKPSLPREHWWVRLVFGNDGWDAICDHHCGDNDFGRAMDAFDAEAFV